MRRIGRSARRARPPYSRKASCKASSWAEVYEKIRAYRCENSAPVDYVGCEKLPRRNLSQKAFRFETLVSLILSAQTTDLSLAPAIKKLQSFAPDGLSPKKIIELGQDKIMECISSIGLASKKTKYLLDMSKELEEKWGGDIPDTLASLQTLPGVGPKIAALAMSVAWNNPVAIGVDVHVHRISNRLGWVNTKTPEQTRRSLEDMLPKHLWKPVNPLLVGFGQTLCSSAPKCSLCPVKDLCPSAALEGKLSGQ